MQAAILEAMFSWFRRHLILVGISLAIVVGGVIWFVSDAQRQPDWLTATVERGTVSEVVSVSGTIEALTVANLSFPSPGVVTDVFVSRGDQVETGQLLATRGSAQLVAERAATVASLTDALAARQSLEAGPTGEERAVTTATVASARTALEETRETEALKVANARANLLSTGLSAQTSDGQEDATPPSVSGTYTCSEEGSYEITVYRSNADSGFSFTFSGLESGTAAVTTEQPSALGSCGLFLQFSAGDRYSNTSWTIAVPNERSASYITLKNAYELALRQQAANIASAETARDLAENQAVAANAGPRVEAMVRANATIQAAQARIAAIDASIADTSITAPFAGTITNVDIVTGETATQAPVITLLGDQDFRVTARVPEIDITKIATEQSVVVRFDARSDESYSGQITFISPLPTIRSGVAYFDADVQLESIPAWIRSGLNADIDITLRSLNDTLLVPTHFLTTSETGATVQVLDGAQARTTPVEVLFKGNDGFSAITGLNEGVTIVTPRS